MPKLVGWHTLTAGMRLQTANGAGISPSSERISVALAVIKRSPLLFCISADACAVLPPTRSMRRVLQKDAAGRGRRTWRT